MTRSRARLNPVGALSVVLLTQTACFPLFGSRSDMAPPPVPHGTARTMPAIPPSMITARVAIPIGWIRDSIDAWLPREAGRLAAWQALLPDDVGMPTKSSLLRRATDLGAVRDTALVQKGSKYGLKTGMRQVLGLRPAASCGSSGEGGSGASVGPGQLSLMTSLIPRADWSIEPLSRRAGGLLDTLCAMRGLDVNALGDRLVAARLTSRLAAIDSAVRDRLRFAEIVRPLWNRAQAPIDLGRDVKIVLAPRRVLVGPVKLENDSIVGALGLVGTPTVWVGATPPATSSAPLPELETGPVDTESVLRTAIVVSDTVVRRAIADTLVGLTVKRRFGPFTFSTTVTDVGFFAAGDSAVVRVRLAGKVRGDVWLIGVPTYDPQTRYFMLKNVSLTAASSSFLTRAAFSAGKDALERGVEKSARIALGPRLDSLRARLGDVADRDFRNVRLQVSVQKIAPVGIVRLAEGFATLVDVRGTALITGKAP